MIRQPRVFFLTSLLIFGLVSCAALAQEAGLGRTDPPPRFGAALSMNYPYEDFGDSYKTGYGIHAIMDYPFIPLLNFTADIGWNHFPRSGTGRESMSGNSPAA